MFNHQFSINLFHYQCPLCLRFSLAFFSFPFFISIIITVPRESVLQKLEREILPNQFDHENPNHEVDNVGDKFFKQISHLSILLVVLVFQQE